MHPPEAADSPPAPTAWRAVALVAAVAAAVHLAVAVRYGWHRDEFYYVICGRHPAWGYVDQPPLTPLLARAATVLPGLWPLRLLAIALQTGCIVLTARLAAELGGRRRAQVIAAAAVAACPIFVGASALYGTAGTDQFMWLATLVLIVRALRVERTSAWAFAGIAAGVGLQNKSTIAILLAGVLLGLFASRRDALRTIGPWLAGAIAVAFAIPNLVWDAGHGWPNLEMAKALSRAQGGTLGSLQQLPLLLVLLAGPLLAALWLIGVRWLLSPAGRDHRWIAVTAATAVLLVTVSGGKPYYAAPMLAALYAAGAVRVEAADTARGRFGWPVALVASFVIASLVWLPVLPVRAANAMRAVSPVLVETYGWPQFVDQVAAAAATAPAGAPIFTSNYGEAGALTVLGPGAGVDRPIYSGHNNHTLWGPPPGRPDTVLCVGKFKSGYLERSWARVRKIASIALPDGVDNAEKAGHAAVYLCEQPRGDWAELWPSLRHFD
ncbi:MAG: glycosyltransferase family 39 protein [Mycobacterium sp.]